MSKEIYRVRGVAGTCWPNKDAAEAVARVHFPHESETLRYSRIYSLRMEGAEPTPAQPKQTIAFTVHGFDENREDDTHEYCFSTADEARAFIKAAEDMPYSDHMTWRRNSIVINDDMEQSLARLLRDLTDERKENGYDEEGEEA